MATTAAEIAFLARVDAAERVEVLIERMAATCGEAPVGEEYSPLKKAWAEAARVDGPEFDQPNQLCSRSRRSLPADGREPQ